MYRRSSLTVSRRFWLCSLFLLFCCLPAIGSAQERRVSFRDGDLLRGQRFRRIFHNVVVTPSTWTVDLLADGQRIALGTIVGKDGWILTKASQAKKADRVQLSDGRQFAYTNKGYRQDLDLAMLKIEANELPEVEWEENAPKVGAWMLTVSTGPVPLAVGVMSVPRRKIPRLKVHGYLGVELDRDNLPKINRVFPNSGASEAGLQAGDVVLKVNQDSIETGRQLVRTLQKYRPGDTLSLQIRRDEDEYAYAVTLMHPYGNLLSRMAFQNQMGGPLSFRRDDFEAAYQHDSVLEPEDCGGPVVNLESKAVGINIARAGRTESYTLPADLITPILEDLKSGRYPPPVATMTPGLIPSTTTTTGSETMAE